MKVSMWDGKLKMNKPFNGYPKGYVNPLDNSFSIQPRQQKKMMETPWLESHSPSAPNAEKEAPSAKTPSVMPTISDLAITSIFGSFRHVYGSRPSSFAPELGICYTRLLSSMSSSSPHIPSSAAATSHPSFNALSSSSLASSAFLSMFPKRLH